MRGMTLVVLLLSTLARAEGANDWLPEKLAGLSACGPVEVFSGKKLFDYMDGGAELYLAYGFSDIAVRVYQQGGRKLTAEIYRLGSELEAFGIFSHFSKGEAVDVGARGSFSTGLLAFHKGAYLVRLVSAAEPQPTRESMLEAAKELAKKIPGASRLPADAALLPEGAQAGSLRYLTAPDAARTVWLDGEGDVLLTMGGRAFTATYTGTEGDLQATRVVYPEPEAARKACQALAAKLSLKVASEGDCAAAGKTPEETFSVISQKGNVLRWVAGAADQQSAEQLLKKNK